MGLRILYCLALMLVATGATVLIAFSGRMLAPQYGLPPTLWTVILSSSFAGLSLGLWKGARQTGTSDNPVKARRFAAWGLALLAFWALLEPIIEGWVAIPAIALENPLIYVAGWVALWLFLPPFLVIGWVMSLLIGLTLTGLPDQRLPWLGRALGAATAGIPVGLLLAEFLFKAHLGISATLSSLVGLFAVLALFLALGDSLRAVLLVALLGGVSQLPAAWAWPTGCDLEHRDGCLGVGIPSRNAGDFRTVKLNGAAKGAVNPKDLSLLYDNRDRFINAMVGQQIGMDRPPRSLILDGGASPLPRAWAKKHFGRSPAGVFLVSDPTPSVSRMAELHFGFRESPTIQLDHRDGRLLVQSLPAVGGIELVIGAPNLLPHQLTREFNDALVKRLDPDGVYLLPVNDHAADPRLLVHLVKTLQVTFPRVDVWRHEDDHDRRDYVIRAANSVLPPPPVEIVGWTSWPRADLHARTESPNVTILSDDHAPIQALLGYPVPKM
ncbi:fused MFS/spermidine synthase [Magnetospira sp. QH-2]|uniref:fused MFS/spermidine synthase n=1 Tax=Magnetospira sp. (strain QH-2) TaxID=1288970 RepID=UPI0003E81721|nr:fused MFS/spermidine synthase [Magnetospira sp. QH-2]CCQ73846.1 Conserved membrane protein of unknown function [Magnetospira sp. QH-2]